ncbi:hypothetical protein Tco_1086243 [Tanacetum coccineum]
MDVQVNLEEKTKELDQGQAGSDPGRTPESRPSHEQVVMDEDQARPDPGASRGTLDGPDPKPMHDGFMADLYPKVQESLKLSDDEHVILEDLISLTGTLSSMKNLEDAYAVEDQFINDKSTEDESKKPIVEAEVVSMVTVPIYQASSTIPPLSTPVPIIDLSPPKPASSTTSLHSNNNDNNNTPSTSSTTIKLNPIRLRDLPHKIDEAVHEQVKEAIQIALQAPLCDHFRDLSKEDMKEMLHQRMFESGSYKSLLEHIALYEALEASMERAQRDELLAEKDKSRKRHRDDQDPPPPPDLDLSKRRQHNTGTSEDIPIPVSANISDLEDIDSAHLPKTKQRPEWFKPITDDDRTATLEPAWVIPPSHILDAENNWAKALASTYQAPTENSLLEKTGDMRTFMHWYCQKMGKTELTQADLEGQAYEFVKPFYPDVVQLQFQMEECHKMLTDQIDWENPEGNQVRIDISKPMPLSGPPTHVVRTHMRILSVVSIKAFSRYKYNYLKEITLRRADYQEYTIAEKDFKNLYPSNFEDLNLLLLQGHLNHLSGLEKRMLSTAVNLWTRNLVIRHWVEDF